MNLIKNLAVGTVIGVANIIPGVSGGTMALVLGIYERLITAIHNISANTVKAVLFALSFKKERIEELKNELRKIDALFLVLIAIGAVGAIVALAKVMTFLLNEKHDQTYGFFFGLVLMSALAPFRLIKEKTISVFIIFLLAGASLVMLSNSMSGERLVEKAQVKYEMKIKKEQGITEETGPVSPARTASYIFFFIAGAIAISAMILPGVSGSFLLLLMGAYFDILKAIATKDLAILSVFSLGCIAGLLLFTRLLNLLLEKWHDLTMGALLGLVMGSLWLIWPFKTSQQVGDTTVYLFNHLPESAGANELLTFLAFLAGSLIVTALFIIEKRMNPETAANEKV